ncbi:MAG: conjugative transfer signal peptidase TraF [Nitrosospira sp.]|nr:conjugative transfer signal peptidase TraF [Nitrosospira sp.]
MSSGARFCRHTAVAAIGLLLLGFVCSALGLRVNATKSIPVGVYRIVDEPVEKGGYVIFCPPESSLFDEARERGYIAAGFCPGDYGFMMKRVLARENDRIVSTGEGLRINGALLPSSLPLRTDKAGRTMPPYPFSDYTLGESQLLLMSDVSGTSFDGRYFGPVDVSQVRGVIRPVVTF